MGDFKANGQGCIGNAVGVFRLDGRNNRGDNMQEWAETHLKVVANTWFKNHKRRLRTDQSWNKKPDRLHLRQTKVQKLQ